MSLKSILVKVRVGEASRKLL